MQAVGVSIPVLSLTITTEEGLQKNRRLPAVIQPGAPDWMQPKELRSTAVVV